MGGGGAGGGGMGGGGGQIGMQNMIAQQNREMEALERRGRERSRGMTPGGMGGASASGMGGGAGVGAPMGAAQPRQGPRVDDDDSAGMLLVSSPVHNFQSELTQTAHRRSRSDLNTLLGAHEIQAKPRAHERGVSVRRVRGPHKAGCNTSEGRRYRDTDTVLYIQPTGDGWEGGACCLFTHNFICLARLLYL